MSTIQEVLPGDTLKRITEERRYMDEFVDWMKRRIELDRKYLEELKALKSSANPQWFQSGVSPLVYPMVECLDREVEERQATCDTMNTYLEELNDSPDHDEETGECMIGQYDDLIAACKTHEECRAEASSTQAVKEMKRWHEQANRTNGKRLWNMNDEDFNCLVLPLVERNYRESVVRQQKLARATNGWHQSTFPELLDRHQSRSEEIKTLMARLVSKHSRLLTGLVTQLEATKNSVYEFSSSSFISRTHDQQNSESNHTYMKEAVHVDFSNGTIRLHIIFGTVSQTPIEARRAMEVLKERRFPDPLGFVNMVKDKALELEQSSTTQGSQVHSLSDEDLVLLCCFGLLSNPPLIPLLDEEIKRYGDGVPRNKMCAIMSRVTKPDEVAALFYILHSLSVIRFSALSCLFTHRPDTWEIIRDIYRKWDFSNNCPLPLGVKREWKP